MLKKIITFVAIIVSAECASDVLLWQVNETSTVDGGAMYDFIATIEDDETHWPAARVRAEGGQQGTAYLNIWGPNPDTGLPEEWDGSEGVWIGDVGGGYWGTGLNQSSFETEIAREMTFAMEIGRNTYDEMSDTVVWVTLAESDPVYGSMLSAYIYERFDLNPLTAKVWTPAVFHTVAPEPSAGILFILGCSAILLSRKNRRA